MFAAAATEHRGDKEANQKTLTQVDKLTFDRHEAETVRVKDF